MITIFVGGLVGVIIAEPNTLKEAFISGLGWFGLITGFSSDKNE